MISAKPAVWCASVTPLDADGGCDVPRLAGHLRHLLQSGCDGVVLFGTTGEGASFTVAERLAAVDGVLAAGIPGERVLLGSIETALPNAVEAACGATRRNLRGVLATPPFFYKDVTEEGITAAYRHLIQSVDDPRLRLYLYHIPQVAGVGVPVRTVHDLLDSHPDTIAGFKDSACNADATAGHLSAIGHRVDVFVGFEPHVPTAVAAGGAGTICGLSNLMPGIIRRLVDEGSANLVSLTRTAAGQLQAFPLVPAMKAALAAQTGAPAWRRCRPPYKALSEADGRRLLAAMPPLSRAGMPA